MKLAADSCHLLIEKDPNDKVLENGKSWVLSGSAHRAQGVLAEEGMSVS